MKNKHLFSMALVAILSLNSLRADAQGMAVNRTGSTAAASSMLDVNDTAKGVLLPRMTLAQKNAISSPATGLIVYQTDGTSGFYYYNGAAWTAIGAGGGSGTVTSVSSGNLAPIFTSTVTSASSTPAIAYTISNAASYTVFTNSTNATSTPSYGKVVPQALFATSGVPSSSTFYRGDGSWATPSGGGGSGQTWFNSPQTPLALTATYFAAAQFATAKAYPQNSTVAPTAMTFDKICVNALTTTGGSGSPDAITIQLYVNNSPSGLSVTVNGSVTVNTSVTACGSTGSVSVSPGDLLNLVMTHTNNSPVISCFTVLHAQ